MTSCQASAARRWGGETRGKGECKGVDGPASKYSNIADTSLRQDVYVPNLAAALHHLVTHSPFVCPVVSMMTSLLFGR